MFNVYSSNSVIAFFPGSRGNFLRCCLTLSPHTADASFKSSSISDRTRIYKERVLETPKMICKAPWGPCHMDGFPNYTIDRINGADYSEKYIHCGHLHQIPQINYTENTGLNDKKFINISLTDSEIDNIIKNHYNVGRENVDFLNDKTEIYKHSDSESMTNFFNTDEWYDIPHADILHKDKFIEHCYNIDNNCFIDMISEFYDVYSDVCISSDKRF